jgi:hypothetical protein
VLIEGLIALLAADSGVQAAMGPRTDGTSGIFSGEMPEGTPPPIIVYSYTHEAEIVSMDGPDVYTEARIEFLCQAAKYGAAIKLARAIRQAFNSFQGTLSEGTQVDSIRRTSQVDSWGEAPFFHIVSMEFVVQYRDTGS